MSAAAAAAAQQQAIVRAYQHTLCNVGMASPSSSTVEESQPFDGHNACLLHLSVLQQALLLLLLLSS
jgi:hypothetical protein